MRAMMGIRLRKFVSMRITVSMKSAEFCPNPYRCTHSNGNPIQTLRNVHTSGDRHFLKGALPLNNHKSTKKVAIQMASIAKMYIFTAFGCARPHMPPLGGRMSGDDNIVTAAKVDSRQRCRNSKLSKEGLLSKQNTTCILK